MLEAGIKGTMEITVTDENTASHYGSGMLPVYATPSMVALMEHCCQNSVAPYLEEGMGTVGISLNIQHTAATPVSMKVTAESVLTAVDGRKLTFEVVCRDECGEIGRGSHERFIIKNESFMNKVNAKLGK